jgi:hypothetical protein|tara:strand:- start:1238 stop:1504 length:267 start_codon:yes stop_codon:yes gene_type:complete
MSENIVELESLKRDIEHLSKEHHITILKILKKRIENLNENKNGVFINLSEISPAILEELTNYCLHVKSQELKLDTIDHSQKEMENLFT